MIRDRIFISLLYLISYVLILFGYYKFISPIYGYSGFKWTPDIFKIIESACLVFLIPLTLPDRFNKPSDIILHLQFLFPIVPMLALYGAADLPRSFTYFALFAFFIVVFIASMFRLRVVQITQVSPVMFQRTLFILSWVVILSILLMGGYKFLNFDFAKVYDLRAEVKANLPGFYAYLIPFTSKILLPFALVLSVINRDIFFSVAAIIGSILLFGLTTNKGTLFYPFVVLSVYFILSIRTVISALLVAYLFIIVISILDFFISGADSWVGSLMLRRTFFVPALLSYFYYDFFSVNPFVLWSQSKLTFGLIEPRYLLDSSHLIGLHYFGSERIGSNTGWLGSGYMNAGLVGLIIYSIIIGFLLAVFNAYAALIGKRIVIAISLPAILTLIMSSDLPTAFFNHGILLCLILFSFMTLTDHRAVNYRHQSMA